MRRTPAPDAWPQMNSMSFELPPPRREPAFFLPAVVIVLVGVLLAIYGVMSLLGEPQQISLAYTWGFVPGEFTFAAAPAWFRSHVASSAVSPDALAQARAVRDYCLSSDCLRLHTFATYAFLHGSWVHVGLNSVWLVAFGPPVARRFGPVRFLAFFLVLAIAGALAQWAIAPFEVIPVIGASASDSGLMAASARFIFRRGEAAKADALSNANVGTMRLATLRELMTDRRALVFFGIWLATNFLFGAGASVLGAADGPIAWVAHVGGFVAGLLLFGLFDMPLRRPTRAPMRP